MCAESKRKQEGRYEILGNEERNVETKASEAINTESPTGLQCSLEGIKAQIEEEKIFPFYNTSLWVW